MKKLFIFFAIIPLFTNAQNSKTKKTSKNISVGLSFSPNYNYRTLINKDDNPFIEPVIINRDMNEIGKLGFSTGANVNIKLSKIFEFQTGLFYSDKGYKTNKVALDLQSTGPDVPTHYRAKYQMHYLDIPLKLNYITGQGRLKFIAGAGFSANLFLNGNVNPTVFYGDGREENRGKQSLTNDYKKFNISALASIGLEYKLKENIFLRAEPTFQYGLKTVGQPRVDIAEYLWNVGLNVGIHLRLK